MSYQALLFCPDEKTCRVISQVLADLEFAVEPCSEPFAAVKKLMATQFDAIVVDCDNEQNSALLFKSARNSALNLNSLAVGVVEGQAGVAKAFRIGANLVLTKPLNVEQSKGTLRVARGLLKKAEAGKNTANPAAVPHLASEAAATAHAPAKPVPAPFPTVTSRGPLPPAASAAVESGRMTTAERRPNFSEAPAHLPTAKSGATREETHDKPKESPWQALTPAASAMKGNEPQRGPATAKPAAAASSNSTDNAVAKRHPFNTGLGPASPVPAGVASAGVSSAGISSAGAATAPAKEATVRIQLIPDADGEESKMPTGRLDVASEDGGDSNPESEGAPIFEHAATGTRSSKTPVIVAIAVCVLCAAGYFAWSKISPPSRPATSRSVPAQAAATTAAISAVEQTGAEPAQAPPTFQDATGDAQSNTQSKPGSEIEVQGGRLPGNEKPSPTKVAASQNADSESGVEVKLISSTKKSADPMTVKSTPESTEEVAEPPALQVESSANAQAVAGLVNTSSLPMPKHSGDILKVSQGITEGLLVKKVSPRYPSQAIQMRKEGTVQLLANIGKDGSISSTQVIKGDPILAQAALAAVQQWKYRPYLLDGEPIAVQTQISVSFKLP